MMRVPLGDLRVALSDPTNYVRTFRPGRGEGGPSKYGMFLHAIGEFHKDNDLVRAQDYLEATLTKNFKNIGELPEYARKLETYAREWRSQGNPLVRYRDNVTVPVPANYSTFVVSGQTARVDLVPSGGYGIWMFVRDQRDWESDPRMPLLQFSYAQRLDVSMDSIDVGVYDFELGTYAARKFSASEVRAARRKLAELLAALKARFDAKP